MSTQDALGIVSDMEAHNSMEVSMALVVVRNRLTTVDSSVREALEWLRQGDRGRAVEALERVKP